MPIPIRLTDACVEVLGRQNKIIRKADLEPSAQWHVFNGRPITLAFQPNPVKLGTTLLVEPKMEEVLRNDTLTIQ